MHLGSGRRLCTFQSPPPPPALEQGRALIVIPETNWPRFKPAEARKSSERVEDGGGKAREPAAATARSARRQIPGQNLGGTDRTEAEPSSRQHANASTEPTASERAD